MSHNVKVVEVSTAGLSGLFARPGGGGEVPSIVAFGGSSGGLGPSEGWARALAQEGFAVLAIAYFAGPGLPSALEWIEVETVERAAAWLRSEGHVADGPVGVMGISRGSELALLASVLVDAVGPVVAFAPSGLSWSALGPQGPFDAPAWTFRGEPSPTSK
jgi:dienelactone hydrolase